MPVGHKNTHFDGNNKKCYPKNRGNIVYVGGLL